MDIQAINNGNEKFINQGTDLEWRDPYNDYFNNDKSSGWSGNGIPGLFMKLFTGIDFNEKYKTARDRAAINSARAWDEYFDSTKYQRAVKDVQKAGYNPWLLFNSGSLSANGKSSSAQAMASKSNKDETGSLLGAIIKLIGKILAA